MVLNVPLDLGALLASAKWVEKTDMARYVCDGVSLTRLRARIRRFSDGRAEVQVRVFVYNEARYDKWAHVELDLSIDDTQVANDITENIDAEEHTTRDYRALLPFRGNRLDNAVKAALTITVRVTDDQIQPPPAEPGA